MQTFYKAKIKNIQKTPRFYTGLLTTELHPVPPHIKVDFTKTTQFLYKKYKTVLEQYNNINHSLQHFVKELKQPRNPIFATN